MHQWLRKRGSSKKISPRISVPPRPQPNGQRMERSHALPICPSQFREPFTQPSDGNATLKSRQNKNPPGNLRRSRFAACMTVIIGVTPRSYRAPPRLAQATRTFLTAKENRPPACSGVRLLRIANGKEGQSLPAVDRRLQDFAVGQHYAVSASTSSSPAQAQPIAPTARSTTASPAPKTNPTAAPAK